MPVIDYHVVPNQMAPQQHLPTLNSIYCYLTLGTHSYIKVLGVVT